MRTVFLVDRQGDLAWPVDIHRWADRRRGPARPRSLPSPLRRPRQGDRIGRPRLPGADALAGDQGLRRRALAFAFSDARWRLLDIPTKFAAWCRAVGRPPGSDLAARIFQAALNLAEDRKGALFVVLRDPATSIPQLIAPADRIVEEVAGDDPEDPDNLSPRLAKRSLAPRRPRPGRCSTSTPPSLEALAGIDGAVVTDLDGRLLTFGAILRIDPEALLVARAVEGARTARRISPRRSTGPTLKVSEDGLITMFLGGRRVWDL